MESDTLMPLEEYTTTKLVNYIRWLQARVNESKESIPLQRSCLESYYILLHKRIETESITV
jgi:hypothetical protein